MKVTNHLLYFHFTLLLSTQVLKKSMNSNQLYSAVKVNHDIVYKKTCILCLQVVQQ